MEELLLGCEIELIKCCFIKYSENIKRKKRASQKCRDIGFLTHAP